MYYFYVIKSTPTLIKRPLFCRGLDDRKEARLRRIFRVGRKWKLFLFMASGLAPFNCFGLKISYCINKKRIRPVLSNFLFFVIRVKGNGLLFLLLRKHLLLSAVSLSLFYNYVFIVCFFIDLCTANCIVNLIKFLDWKCAVI